MGLVKQHSMGQQLVMRIRLMGGQQLMGLKHMKQLMMEQFG
jgi:hypothetical protein